MSEKNKHIEEDKILNVFREKLQDFQIPVDENCWDEIYAQINEKKKHRIIPLWWWMSGGAVAIIVLLLSISIFRGNLKTNSSQTASSEEAKQYIQKNRLQTTQSQKKLFAVTTKTEKTSVIKQKEKQKVIEKKMTYSDDFTNKFIPETDQTLNQNSFTHKDSTENPIDSKDNNLAKINKEKDIAVEEEPVGDWTDNLKKEKTKSNWFLAANAGAGNSNSASNVYSPLYSDAVLTRVMYASTSNTTLLAPENFAEKHFFTPMSAGIIVGKSLTNKLSIATGLKYTLLYTTFSESNVDADLTLHYLGIPFSLIYDIFRLGRFGFYISGGITAEKGLSSVYVQHQYWGTEITTIKENTRIDGIQLSVNAATGLNYNIVKNIQLYAQPEFSYFFDNHQPISIRTDNPLVISVNVGLKLNF
jgi:hypothetical protein